MVVTSDIVTASDHFSSVRLDDTEFVLGRRTTQDYCSQAVC